MKPIEIKPGLQPFWDEKKRLVVFNPEEPITLAHEIGHARLGHKRTRSPKKYLVQEIEAAKFAQGKYGKLDLEDLYDAAVQAYWVGRMPFSKIVDLFKQKGIPVDKEVLRFMIGDSRPSLPLEYCNPVDQEMGGF